MSKEMNELAARHTLELLPLSSSTLPFFRLSILPRRGQHITHVDLSSSPLGDLLEATLLLLPLPPSISGLDLSAWSAGTLFDTHVHGSRGSPEGRAPGYDLQWEAFLRIAPRIRRLKLQDFEVHQLGTLLPPFVNLRSLVVDDVHGLTHTDSMLAVVAEHLFDLTSLESLDIEAGDREREDEDEDEDPRSTAGLERLRNTPPSLKSLKIYDHVAPLDWSTVTIFAPTLETLHLTFQEVEPAPANRDPFPPTPHPHH